MKINVGYVLLLLAAIARGDEFFRDGHGSSSGDSESLGSASGSASGHVSRSGLPGSGEGSASGETTYPIDLLRPDITDEDSEPTTAPTSKLRACKLSIIETFVSTPATCYLSYAW